MSTVATEFTKRCTVTLGFSAEMGANAKHDNWNLICHEMGYESAPLAIETREHPASKTSWVLADGKLRQHGSRMLRKYVIFLSSRIT